MTSSTIDRNELMRRMRDAAQRRADGLPPIIYNKSNDDEDIKDAGDDNSDNSDNSDNGNNDDDNADNADNNGDNDDNDDNDGEDNGDDNGDDANDTDDKMDTDIIELPRVGLTERAQKRYDLPGYDEQRLLESVRRLMDDPRRIIRAIIHINHCMSDTGIDSPRQINTRESSSILCVLADAAEIIISRGYTHARIVVYLNGLTAPVPPSIVREAKNKEADMFR